MYGVMPANGLIYAPQNPCACYEETKSMGFNALAPKDKRPQVRRLESKRLTKGPAYGKIENRKVKIENIGIK